MKRFRLLCALCAAAAALALFAAEAAAHLAYTWQDLGANAGGAGVVKNASEVLPDVVVGFGLDPYVFSFKDHNGEWRLLYADESTPAKDDSVYIFDPADFTRPLRNASSWGTSTHGVTSDPDMGYLYLMTYATGNNRGAGGITMVDMRNGYMEVKTALAPSLSNTPSYMSYYGEAVAVMNGKVYGLYSCRDGGFTYDRSILVEYDMLLNSSRVIELDDGTDSARNTTYMTVHGESLYIAAMGGMFGKTQLRGGVWKFTPEGNPEVEEALDVETLSEYQGKEHTAGVIGLDIASNGDMYVMTGVLTTQVEDPILWKTNVDKPEWVKVDNFEGGGNGYLGQALLLDESVNILWSPSYMSATNALYGYDISNGGFTLKHTFSQRALNASSAVHRMAVFGGEVNAPPMQEAQGLSGGCDAGLASFAALVPLMAAFILLKRRRRG
jgi:hypothetical protein